MAANKTSLSAGIIISKILKEDPEVTKIAKKIFPVVTDEANLPYIIYRRSGFDKNPNKGIKPADTVFIDVLCCASGYEGSIQLAEAVRSALDGVQCKSGEMTMRSCDLVDGDETYQDDAFIQNLVFSIKI